ncbi:hypothetical protein BASA81_016192 [Batrachochytrium salamandrivorans]|nr:hypothetical protein BASA81_016192 [Batrachochytrium salamandrivorans]
MDPADTFRGFINQLELVFQLQDKRYDTDRKKIATLGTLLQITLYPGAAVQSSLNFDAIHLRIHLFLASNLSSTNSDLLITTVDLQQINLLLRSLQLPSNNVQLRMTWTLIFARRGPLTTAETTTKVKSRTLPCLWYSQDTSKPLVPRSNSRFRPQRQVQAIEMEGHNFEVSGNDLGRL